MVMGKAANSSSSSSQAADSMDEETVIPVQACLMVDGEPRCLHWELPRVSPLGGEQQQQGASLWGAVSQLCRGVPVEQQCPHKVLGQVLADLAQRLAEQLQGASRGRGEGAWLVVERVVQGLLEAEGGMLAGSGAVGAVLQAVWTSASPQQRARAAKAVMLRQQQGGGMELLPSGVRAVSHLVMEGGPVGPDDWREWARAVLRPVLQQAGGRAGEEGEEVVGLMLPMAHKLLAGAGGTNSFRDQHDADQVSSSTR